MTRFAAILATILSLPVSPALAEVFRNWVFVPIDADWIGASTRGDKKGSTLLYLCSPDKQKGDTLSVSGLPASYEYASLYVDGVEQPQLQLLNRSPGGEADEFLTIIRAAGLLAPAYPASDVLAPLMTGRFAEVVTPSATITFSLSGSRPAISAAIAKCGK